MRVHLDRIGVEADGNHLLDGVSVDVAAGTTLGVVGPNGSGKSTLLRCLYRALAPSRGSAFIDGTDVRGRSALQLAQQLAVLAQHEGSALDFRAREVVALGRHPHSRDTAVDERLVTEAMAWTETTHLAERSVLSLSGGERQRVMLARALAQSCPVIALDEPTNHLDLRHQLRVIARVARSSRTVLVALHDLNLATSLCDQVLVLDDGRVVADGAPEVVLTPDLVEQVYGVRPARVTHPVDGSAHLVFSPQLT